MTRRIASGLAATTRRSRRRPNREHKIRCCSFPPDSATRRSYTLLEPEARHTVPPKSNRRALLDPGKAYHRSGNRNRPQPEHQDWSPPWRLVRRPPSSSRRRRWRRPMCSGPPLRRRRGFRTRRCLMNRRRRSSHPWSHLRWLRRMKQGEAEEPNQCRLVQGPSSCRPAVLAGDNVRRGHSPARDVLGIARQDHRVSVEGDDGDVAVDHIPRAWGCRCQHAYAPARLRVERQLGDEVACQEARESRLTVPSAPNLSDDGGAGGESHMAAIREQDKCPNGRRASFERDERSGVEHDGLHAARRLPGRLDRAFSALTIFGRGSPSARAMTSAISGEVGSRRSNSSRSETSSARARALARIASATHALTEGERPARTSASASRARSSSILMVILRIPKEYYRMHGAATPDAAATQYARRGGQPGIVR
jgi:hypothetical protein